MAIKLMSLVAFAFIVAVALVQSSEAQTLHVVGGDTLGWIVPPGGATVYATWAAAQTFAVGDVLQFNYVTGAHDVAEVTKTAYEDCTKTSPLSTVSTGPTNITLATSGEHYYICTFGTHCTSGQKVAVNVTTSSPPPPPGTPASPPPPPGTPASPPPPPPSSAATAALPAITLLSIFVALLH